MLTFTFDWISTSCTVRCTSSLLYCSFNPFYLFQVLLCPLLPLQLCLLSFLLRVREGWRAIQYTMVTLSRQCCLVCPALAICTKNMCSQRGYEQCGVAVLRTQLIQAKCNISFCCYNFGNLWMLPTVFPRWKVLNQSFIIYETLITWNLC